MMSGGCLCGAVRYRIDGPPEFCVLCYCRDCQRASGSGHVPVMGARRAQVTITGKRATLPRGHRMVVGENSTVEL